MTNFKHDGIRKFRRYKSIPYMISILKKPNRISKSKFEELLKLENSDTDLVEDD